MSEVLATGVEAIPYDPDRYVALVEYWDLISEDATDERRNQVLENSRHQLQSDIANLRPQLSVTFEGRLAEDASTAAWHMAHWEEYGFGHGGFGIPRRDRESRIIGQEARDYLHRQISETAEANGWRAFFPVPHISYGNLMPGDLSWRMEQSSYIFDGERLVLINPTLFQITDGSVLGDSHLVERLGPSHLRKHAELRTILPVDGDQIEDKLLRKQPFSLSSGIPENRITKEELVFLEHVLAAYY